jgi:hypothetical protein
MIGKSLFRPAKAIKDCGKEFASVFFVFGPYFLQGSWHMGLRLTNYVPRAGVIIMITTFYNFRQFLAKNGVFLKN